MKPTPHPCAGRSAVAVEVFEAIAINLDPPFRPRTIAALLKAGLIEQVSTKAIGKDRFGAITIPVYAVPLPVHLQWCKWCSENVPDAEKSSIG